jgi:A/G-specific adenine glycosylase
MLQQTQVDRVRTRWTRFLERFPTVVAAAEAPTSAVIDEWSGLGYNRRAVNLHRCAVAVADDYNGRFPTELGDLLKLPGVGPYTARAVRVFAFEQAESVLDTNVARILARTEGRALSRPEGQELADRSRTGDPWIWNQAMLDIGAGHCRPRPSCQGCPFTSRCRWHEAGLEPPDPATGSAAVTGKQSRFEGSDRQGRGRLVRTLRAGPLAASEVAVAAGWPEDPARAAKAVDSLVRDGLVEREDDGTIRLP